jgi:hypothetical protein
VRTGKSEGLMNNVLPEHFPADTHVHADLNAFANWLLNTETSEGVH